MIETDFYEEPCLAQSRKLRWLHFNGVWILLWRTKTLNFHPIPAYRFA